MRNVRPLPEKRRKNMHLICKFRQTPTSLIPLPAMIRQNVNGMYDSRDTFFCFLSVPFQVPTITVMAPFWLWKQKCFTKLWKWLDDKICDIWPFMAHMTQWVHGEVLNGDAAFVMRIPHGTACYAEQWRPAALSGLKAIFLVNKKVWWIKLCGE